MLTRERIEELAIDDFAATVTNEEWDAQPKHPLYLKNSTRLVPWSSR